MQREDLFVLTDATELDNKLAYDYYRERDTELSSYASWYLQAMYVHQNLPDQHPKKAFWMSVMSQRRLVWERYLDVLARDEHFARQQQIAE